MKEQQLKANHIPGSLEEHLGETNVEIFVGTKYPYYNRKWKKSKGNKPSWNFAAFFLSMFWMGYRKMYMPVILMLTLFFVTDLVIYFLNDRQLTDSMVNATDSSITAGISIMLGLYGNYFYYIHTRKKINAIESEGLPDEQRKTKLRNQGQTSWLGVLFVVIGLLVYGFLSATLFPTADDKIAILKNGVSEEFPDKTIGEALDSYFSEPEWQLIRNENGEEIIRFTGTVESYPFSMDFVLEDEYFDIVNGEVDGVPIDSDELNDVLYSILQTEIQE